MYLSTLDAKVCMLEISTPQRTRVRLLCVPAPPARARGGRSARTAGAHTRIDTPRRSTVRPASSRLRTYDRTLLGLSTVQNCLCTAQLSSLQLV